MTTSTSVTCRQKHWQLTTTAPRLFSPPPLAVVVVVVQSPQPAGRAAPYTRIFNSNSISSLTVISPCCSCYLLLIRATRGASHHSDTALMAAKITEPICSFRRRRSADIPFVLLLLHVAFTSVKIIELHVCGMALHQINGLAPPVLMQV